MKISKRGEPEKIIWGGGNQGGKIFKMKGGNPTFQVEFRDEKGENGDSQRQISIKSVNKFDFTVISTQRTRIC